MSVQVYEFNTGMARRFVNHLITIGADFRHIKQITGKHYIELSDKYDSAEIETRWFGKLKL